jgi:hypothetical protein
MPTLPADVVNRSLDAILAGVTIGDLNEGTTAARVAVRHYLPTLEQLLRSAHWNFARKSARLLMLQDATGQTPNVAVGTPGMGNWRYEYAWPTDALQARYVTHTLKRYWLYPQGQLNSQSYQLPPQPIMSGIGITPNHSHVQQKPVRFLVSQDVVPTQIGAPVGWDQETQLDGLYGQAPNQQTVILTNLCNASLIYTAMVPYPDEWDVLFQQAVVSALAAYLVVILPDKKFALQMRAQQIAVAKSAIEQARIRDGNEMWGNVDHEPDWMKTRRSYGWCRGVGVGGWGDGGGEEGVLGYGWSSFGFADGSAY